MPATLVALRCRLPTPAGIRNFKPTLRKAAERLAAVHTPEGVPLPPNTLAELQRDMARLGFVVSQIQEIEKARQKRLEQHPETGPDAMVRRLVCIVGIGVETADMLVHEVLSRPMRDRRAVARYAGLTGSPDESGARQLKEPCSLMTSSDPAVVPPRLGWRRVPTSNVASLTPRLVPNYRCPGRGTRPGSAPGGAPVTCSL